MFDQEPTTPSLIEVANPSRIYFVQHIDLTQITIRALIVFWWYNDVGLAPYMSLGKRYPCRSWGKGPLQALILGVSILEKLEHDTAMWCLRFLLRASVDESLLDVTHTNEKMPGRDRYVVLSYR